MQKQLNITKVHNGWTLQYPDEATEKGMAIHPPVTEVYNDPSTLGLRVLELLGIAPKD